MTNYTTQTILQYTTGVTRVEPEGPKLAMKPDNMKLNLCKLYQLNIDTQSYNDFRIDQIAHCKNIALYTCPTWAHPKKYPGYATAVHPR